MSIDAVKNVLKIQMIDTLTVVRRGSGELLVISRKSQSVSKCCGTHRRLRQTQKQHPSDHHF